ncbi:MAG TPA: molecular chaperone Tir, partial [Cyanobacteria bacterium UBA12227]|nr:molecular chaperone Tir [Cyanobacteria bacterium UBA12227]
RGQVELASAFYVERPSIEDRCYEAIAKPGSLIRIKAPRQMGKTSLMARILHHATQQGYATVPLTFQLADSKLFTDLDRFLQWFCAFISLELQLPDRLADYWNGIFASKVSCRSYFERYLLANMTNPLVLGLDEVDRVFQYPELAADFFGLLRAWHEEAKNREIWRKLRLVVVHSTEVYLPMDINQSPFNVGLPIELPEFQVEQVQDLAHRHGLAWGTTEVDQLMAMVGGHPYLIRLALYHIARQEITLPELLITAPTDTGLYSDHLRRHLWNLSQHPELANALKKVVIAEGSVQLDSMQGFKLHSMGLVNLQGNEVTPRCDLYRQYFQVRITSTT